MRSFGIVGPAVTLADDALKLPRMLEAARAREQYFILDDELRSPREYSDAFQPPWPSKPSLVAVAATKLALETAKGPVSGSRVGIFIDRAHGPSVELSEFLSPFIAEGFAKLSPAKFSQTVSNAPLGAIARGFQISGPAALFSDLNALQAARRKLRTGVIDHAVCIGMNSIHPDVVSALRDRGVTNAAEHQNASYVELCACAILDAAPRPAERDAVIQNVYPGDRSGFPSIGRSATPLLLQRLAALDASAPFVIHYLPNRTEAEFIVDAIRGQFGCVGSFDMVDEIGHVFSTASVLAEILGASHQAASPGHPVFSIIQDFNGGYITTYRAPVA